jgi:hypothetical protein
LILFKIYTQIDLPGSNSRSGVVNNLGPQSISKFDPATESKIFHHVELTGTLNCYPTTIQPVPELPKYRLFEIIFRH